MEALFKSFFGWSKLEKAAFKFIQDAFKKFNHVNDLPPSLLDASSSCAELGNPNYWKVQLASNQGQGIFQQHAVVMLEFVCEYARNCTKNGFFQEEYSLPHHKALFELCNWLVMDVASWDGTDTVMKPTENASAPTNMDRLRWRISYIEAIDGYYLREEVLGASYDSLMPFGFRDLLIRLVECLEKVLVDFEKSCRERSVLQAFRSVKNAADWAKFACTEFCQSFLFDLVEADDVDWLKFDVGAQNIWSDLNGNIKSVFSSILEFSVKGEEVARLGGEEAFIGIEIDAFKSIEDLRTIMWQIETFYSFCQFYYRLYGSRTRHASLQWEQNVQKLKPQQASESVSSLHDYLFDLMVRLGESVALRLESNIMMKIMANSGPIPIWCGSKDYVSIVSFGPDRTKNWVASGHPEELKIYYEAKIFRRVDSDKFMVALNGKMVKHDYGNVDQKYEIISDKAVKKLMFGAQRLTEKDFAGMTAASFGGNNKVPSTRERALKEIRAAVEGRFNRNDGNWFGIVLKKAKVLSDPRHVAIWNSVLVYYELSNGYYERRGCLSLHDAKVSIRDDQLCISSNLSWSNNRWREDKEREFVFKKHEQSKWEAWEQLKKIAVEKSASPVQGPSGANALKDAPSEVKPSPDEVGKMSEELQKRCNCKEVDLNAAEWQGWLTKKKEERYCFIWKSILCYYKKEKESYSLRGWVSLAQSDSAKVDKVEKKKDMQVEITSSRSWRQKKEKAKSGEGKWIFEGSSAEAFFQKASNAAASSSALPQAAPVASVEANPTQDDKQTFHVLKDGGFVTDKQNEKLKSPKLSLFQKKPPAATTDQQPKVPTIKGSIINSQQSAYEKSPTVRKLVKDSPVKNALSAFREKSPGDHMCTCGKNENECECGCDDFLRYTGRDPSPSRPPASSKKTVVNTSKPLKTQKHNLTIMHNSEQLGRNTTTGHEASAAVSNEPTRLRRSLSDTDAMQYEAPSQVENLRETSRPRSSTHALPPPVNKSKEAGAEANSNISGS